MHTCRRRHGACTLCAAGAQSCAEVLFSYFTYEDSVPDCQAFQRMATFLGGFNIEIEGVILDRGFAVEEVFRKIDEEKWKYVIMLSTDTYGHKQMLQEHSEEIRWKSRYVMDDVALFGISDVRKLFGNHERTSNICLFFDGGGSSQSIRLIKQIQNAERKAEKAIANGGRAAIEKKLQKYLSIEGEGNQREVIAHYEEWDKSMASKGFFSLTASDGISPKQASAIYKKRDTSETQFCILKSQEGGNTTRVHKTDGIYSKFAVFFISSIIRFEIEDACKAIGLDTNPMIQGLERVALLYTSEGKHEAIRNLTTEQKELFVTFGLNHDGIERLARDFNQRNRTDSRNPERKLPNSGAPITKTNSHKAGRPPVKQQNNVNSLNNGQSQEEASGLLNTLKPKGGRPKGKKDSHPRKPRSDKGIKRGSCRQKTKHLNMIHRDWWNIFKISINEISPVSLKTNTHVFLKN